MKNKHILTNTLCILQCQRGGKMYTKIFDEKKLTQIDEKLRKPFASTVWIVTTMATAFATGANSCNLVEDTDMRNAFLVLIPALATIFSGYQTIKTIKTPRSDFIQKQR